VKTMQKNSSRHGPSCKNTTGLEKNYFGTTPAKRHPLSGYASYIEAAIISPYLKIRCF